MFKKLIQTIRGLVALLSISVAAMQGATIGASEPMAWRFAHPEAAVLAGADFRKLAETADGRQIRDQFAGALGAPLVEQAERLLLSSVVESTGRRSDILILSGSFSLAQLRKLAMQEGAHMVSFKGLEIAAPPGAAAGDAHLAWLPGTAGSTMVLIGTRPAIQAAAERSKAHVESMASVNPLFARARELSGGYPVWVACEGVPQGFGPKSMDPGQGESPDGGDVEGMDMGVRFGETSDLNLWFWTSTEGAAATALKQLQDSANTPEQFVLSPWMHQLKGSIEMTTLVLGAPVANGTAAARIGPLLVAFALPVDTKVSSAPAAAAPQVSMRVKVDANVPMTGIAAVSKAAVEAPMPVPAAAPPAPPKKLFVRIQGLDDGDKDIPYIVKP